MSSIRKSGRARKSTGQSIACVTVLLRLANVNPIPKQSTPVTQLRRRKVTPRYAIQLKDVCAVALPLRCASLTHKHTQWPMKEQGQNCCFKNVYPEKMEDDFYAEHLQSSSVLGKFCSLGKMSRFSFNPWLEFRLAICLTGRVISECRWLLVSSIYWNLKALKVFFRHYFYSANFVLLFLFLIDMYKICLCLWCTAKSFKICVHSGMAKWSYLNNHILCNYHI